MKENVCVFSVPGETFCAQNAKTVMFVRYYRAKLSHDSGVRSNHNANKTD